MADTFWQRLAASIARSDSLVCVGLDPQLDDSRSAADLAAFLKGVVDATSGAACVFKPNIAFYEARGEEGLRVLREVLAHIPGDIPVILDAKRGDITNTAQAYARAAFEWLDAGAITLNPYLGEEGVAPFLAYEGRGAFVLCKTSNPSAGEIQDWTQAGEPLYRHVARRARQWAKGSEVGLVIGATYPEAIADIRAQSAETWFLVPGVGVQGGDLEAVLRAGLRADGTGMVINASRGILYADDPGAAARELREQINRLRRAVREGRSARPSGREAARDRLCRLLLEAGCVQFGEFRLHSGASSPVYVDLRRLVTHPRTLHEVAETYAGLLRPLSYDRIAAIPYAGLPIGTAVSLLMNQPLIYPRREAKEYGTRRLIEGDYRAGERIVLLDDLITSGGSKLQALDPLLAEGLACEDVVVLIDREQGGVEDLAEHGYRVHAALTLRQIVDSLSGQRLLAGDVAHRVHNYLDGV